MPSEVLWALAGSAGFVLATALVVRARRWRRAIGRRLLRLIQCWLYERWDYDRK